MVTSTSSPDLWPLLNRPATAPPALSSSNNSPQAAATSPSKSSRRRKPGQAPQTSTAAPPPTAALPPTRSEGEWRGGGQRGSLLSGRGSSRGGSGSRGASSASSSGGSPSRAMSDFARRTATGKSAGEATTSKVNTAQMDDLVRQLARSGLEASVPALPGQPSRRPLPPPQSAPIPSTSSTAQPTLSSPGKAKKPHKSRKKPRGKQEFDEYEDEPSSPDESGDLLSRISAAPGNDLEAEILNLYGTQRASPEALEAREYLIQELEHIFNSGHWFFGQPHNPRRDPLLIEPFGSVRFGLATSSSDLDLCLFDPYRPNGFEKKFFRSNGEEVALPEIYDMRRIATRLKDAGFRKVLPIPFAGVPIVKFEAKIGNQVIQADINTNERFGVFNSRLINAYCNLHPLVRPLSVFVKFWARQRQLNDPSGSSGPVTFSSYTLILLVLAYLQTRLVLPNLQDASLISLAGVCPTRFWTKPKKLLGKRSRVAKGVVPSTGWDTTFVERLPEEYGFVPAEIGLGELAKGFFRYYADEFVVEETVVSLARGAPFPRLRPFSDFRDTKKKVEKGERKDLGEGDMSAGERFRQSEEDAAMKAFAEEAEEREKEVVDTRASSPVTFGEFEEPQIWMQKLVVQDPFLLTRNTATNVAPDVVDLFQIELRRALTLMEGGAPLATVCASIKNEEGYRSLAGVRKSERKKRIQTNAKERERMATMSKSGAPAQRKEVVLQKPWDGDETGIEAAREEKEVKAVEEERWQQVVDVP